MVGRCYACEERSPCEAHHRTGAGMGRRSHDSQAFALCTLCHRRFHDGSWEFRSWDKHQRRDWQDEAIVRTRARWLERQSALRGSSQEPDTVASK